MPEWWANSDALRDVLVMMGRLPPPQRRFELSEIEPGWLVFDNERERIGRVTGQVDGYLVVQRYFHGVYVWLRLYVPPTYIGEAHEGAILLSIRRDWVAVMDWGHPPRKPSKLHSRH